ncbi:MAG: Rpn family recombination-promoting nuclease/putative transposase [Magnetococcus sp. YQC-5]
MIKRRLITFDWALKRLLRSKANFEVLEGFLSELLSIEIRIIDILESESNKEDALDKLNRVDMKVKNSEGELILIELQYEREFDYLLWKIGVFEFLMHNHWMRYSRTEPDFRNTHR